MGRTAASLAVAVALAGCGPKKLNTPQGRAHCAERAQKHGAKSSRSVLEDMCGCTLDRASAAGYTEESNIPKEELRRFATDCRPRSSSPEMLATCGDVARKRTPSASRAELLQVCSCALEKALASGFTEETPPPAAELERFTGECKAP